MAKVARYAAHRGKPGRPAYDKLALFIDVESRRRILGLSVNEFCDRNRLLILKATRAGRYEVSEIKGRTLRRRYVEAYSALVPNWEQKPRRRGTLAQLLPPEIEKLIAERIAAIKI